MTPPNSFIDLYGKTLTIDNGKEILSEAKLNALKHLCLRDGNLPKLSKKQEKQLLVYAMNEAEKYRNTHSMRYTIMRDVTKAIFNIK